MTKRTAQPTLTDMKLAVIKYHTHSNDNPDNKVGGRVINEKFLIGLGRDACYTSNNSLNFKRKQIADAFADYDQATSDENAYDMNRAANWLATLDPELDELQARRDQVCHLQSEPKVNVHSLWFTNSRGANLKVHTFTK